MRLAFDEPGPCGRVPPKKKRAQQKPKKKLPVLMREALEREANTKKSAKKRGKS